jgi:hypothetical protein
MKPFYRPFICGVRWEFHRTRTTYSAMPEGELTPWITEPIINGEWDACSRLLDAVRELANSKFGKRVLAVA